MLDLGISICQRAGAGLGMKNLQIKWPNEEHSVEDCFNIMFPHSYFDRVLELTNEHRAASTKLFSKHEFMQCISVLLTAALAKPDNIKNLWNTKATNLIPPFRMKERFGLSRDRFIQWKAFIQLAEPRSDDDARKDPWYLAKAVLDAFNECKRANIVPGTENVIDESMGKWIPFFHNISEGIPQTDQDHSKVGGCRS